jgi:uroporphyrin-III C-methyltransferase
LNGLDLPVLMPGSVWLVGAGPGDPGLLTLLAVRALAQADVVVYDALVDQRILALVQPDAVLEYAGKRGGTPSPSQPDISDRLVALAQDGKRVLRLKGGDPFVFGRGGEEALALAAAGIPFRIVPGITAGIGGLAYAGIPVTHRRIARAVTFITGHDIAADGPEGLDWPALARTPVLVCYMARGQISLLTARLIAAGRDSADAAALISKASQPDQQVIETSLDRLADASRASETPAILVIGEVVRLRAALDWFTPASNPLAPGT